MKLWKKLSQAGFVKLDPRLLSKGLGWGVLSFESVGVGDSVFSGGEPVLVGLEVEVKESVVGLDEADVGELVVVVEEASLSLSSPSSPSLSVMGVRRCRATSLRARGGWDGGCGSTTIFLRSLSRLLFAINE